MEAAMSRQNSHHLAFVWLCLSASLFGLSQSAVRAETVKWGPYMVVSTTPPFSPDRDYTQQVQIVSRSGAVLREIHGYSFAYMKVLRLGSRINPCLTLELGDGGRDKLDNVYVYRYSAAHGIKNIVATYGSLEQLYFKPLRHHALPEMVVDSPALNQFDHFSRGALDEVTRVYEWNGDGYRDETARYAEVTAPNIRRLRLACLHSLPAAERYVRGPFAGGQGDSMIESHEDVMAAVINYWANAIAAGKSAETEALFRRRASPRLQAWLRSKHALLLQTLALGQKAMRTDDSKIVEADS